MPDTTGPDPHYGLWAVLSALLAALVVIAVACMAGCSQSGSSVTTMGYQEFYTDPDTRVQYIIAYGPYGPSGLRSVAITPRLAPEGGVVTSGD